MSLSTAFTTNQPGEALPLATGHRRAKRMPFPRRILIYPCDNPADGKAVAMLHDFSPRGIGFHHSRRMPPGCQFILRLIESGGRPVPLLYTVRHCRMIRGEGYCIGAELTRVLGAEQPVISRSNERQSTQSASQPTDPQKKNPPPLSEARQEAKATRTNGHPPHPVTPSGGAGFDASAARGFIRNRTATLTGRTLIGWDRIMDLRLDGSRIWLHLHPPGKDSGWGIFIEAEQLRATIEQLCDTPPAVQIRAAA